MTIEEYTEAILPVIKLSLNERSKKSHLWYLYRQSFYGFTELIDPSHYRVSSEADREYHLIEPGGDFKNMTWIEQPKFDKGRKKFILEHVYTGDMFRAAIEELYASNQLTTMNLVDLVQKNYCVAWITKEENKRLPRSKRGASLQEALEVYSKNGIRLLPNSNG